MVVAAVQRLHVDVALCAAREAIKKIWHKLGLQIAHNGYRELIIDDARCAPGKIDRAYGERFVHCHDKITRAQDAALVAERFLDGFPKCDADIFHRMVLVHVKIAHAFEFEVETAVLGKAFQHVIEEANARGDVVRARAVNVQAQRYLRFERVAFDGADALGPYAGYVASLVGRE